MRIHLEVHLVAETSRVRLQAGLRAGVRRDDIASIFVGHAPSLDLYSQGRSEGEALHAIENAVRLYFVTAHGRGFLDRVLSRFDREAASDRDMAAPKDYIRVIEVPDPVALGTS